MGLREEYNFEYLVNESERLVVESLEKQLAQEENQNVCRCQDCILDMIALALNKVKPHYRVSLIGTLYAHALDHTKYADEVDKAVQGALEKIGENPSCSG
ncbi:MAG: late competence development ComFB family protein [Spirochaetales bacterium]|nr:late competence development ComFB family protein [Spirochaetales bacterium]